MAAILATRTTPVRALAGTDVLKDAKYTQSRMKVPTQMRKVYRNLKFLLLEREGDVNEKG